MFYTICISSFLIIDGLLLAGVGLPNIIQVLGGVAGIIAGVILLYNTRPQ